MTARPALLIALICVFGWVLSAFILARSLVRVKTSEEVIHVIGSARKPIRSDFIIWRGTVSVQDPNLAKAYAAVKADTDHVRVYLIQKGIAASEIFPQAVTTKTLYVKTKGDSGVDASETEGTYRPVASYQMRQQIEVRSRAVDQVDGISRQSTELISQGVPFESEPPMYLYTKLSDLKVEMQAEAAKDARNRAAQIAASSGATLGPLRSANMNMSILTPTYSSAISDNGVDDTTSLDKTITAIVSANYSVK